MQKKTSEKLLSKHSPAYSSSPSVRTTTTACFIGCMVQAVINNFLPLLFLAFDSRYHIPMSKITLLIMANFTIQLLVDIAAPAFVDRIGCRIAVVTAHLLCSAGLLCLAGLTGLAARYSFGSNPDLIFFCILVSVGIYAVGGGLIEVLISPIMESCPTENKETSMSLLHSFYCWGHMGVVLLSTLYFVFFSVGAWNFLAVLWAILPFGNALLFMKAPLFSFTENEAARLTPKALFSRKLFWFFLLLMVSAGASEQAVSQWASAFAEQELGVSKTIGDLAGPMAFALFMGTSRAVYGKFGGRLNLSRCMMASAILCICSYCLMALSPFPVLGLIGCALTGFSVGIFWPGTFSRASASIKNGGTALFALLALAGDVGCTAGPALAGFVSHAFGNRLQAGILAAAIFPVIFFLGLILLESRKSRK